MSNPPNGAARPEARALLAALHPAMVALMDELSGVMFCAKDADGRYVLVNQVFVGRTRERSRRDVIGKRAVDLFVPELAERYESQDELVRTTDKPLRGELELIRHVGGAPGWFLTSKLPLHDESGTYVGLVSVSQDLRSGDADDATIQVLLASPDTSDRLCSPIDTPGELSCRSGARAILNFHRWVHGQQDYADNPTGYRRYLVNHEVGHVLGHGHEPCPGAGMPAPVMQQQTLGLDGCTQNPWPYP